MLLSAVLPIMTLYRLPHGQYGYSGHVINLPQDVASFANSLPRLPSELDVIVVRKEGAMQSHHDFRVRRSVVLHALQRLMANNVYYSHVSIDCNALATVCCQKMVTCRECAPRHWSPPTMTRRYQQLRMWTPTIPILQAHSSPLLLRG